MSFDPHAYLTEISTLSDDEVDLSKAAFALAALRQPDLPLERYFNHLQKLCEETRARHRELIGSGGTAPA